MSKERMIQVTKEEYENLIRDQHTVELLTEYIRQDWQSDPMICLLLGVQGPENHPQHTDQEKNFRKVEEPEEMKEPEKDMGEIYKEIMEIAGKTPKEEKPASPPEEPEKPKKTGKRTKIDRGKVLALHNAGWTNKKIADEMACSEWSVSMILKELSEES